MLSVNYYITVTDHILVKIYHVLMRIKQFDIVNWKKYVNFLLLLFFCLLLIVKRGEVRCLSLWILDLSWQISLRYLNFMQPYVCVQIKYKIKLYSVYISEQHYKICYRFPNKEKSPDQLTTQVRKVMRAATRNMIPESQSATGEPGSSGRIKLSVY